MECVRSVTCFSGSASSWRKVRIVVVIGQPCVGAAAALKRSEANRFPCKEDNVLLVARKATSS